MIRDRRRALVAASLLIITACGGGAPPASTSFDPQVVGPAAAFADFRGRGEGGIKLGGGWYVRQPRHRLARWAWETWCGKEAWIYFASSPGLALDLVAVLRPLRYDGAPRQILTPVLNGHALAPRPLAPATSTLRLPLPQGLLVDGINQLTFRFSYAKSRAALEQGTETLRRAAAFRSIRLLPVGPSPPAVEPPPPPPAGGRPPVIIYVIDTLRADALDLYGAARATSPHLRALAEDGITFDRVWSTSSWTLPATMSLLTGLYPARHGYMSRTRRPRGAATPRLAERLRSLGYETVGISQSYVVSGLYDFERGFDTFYLGDALSRGTNESADARWFLWHHLRQRHDARRPLFFYIHTVDPHAPYTPEGEDRRYAGPWAGRLRTWKYHPQVVMSEGRGDSRRVAARMRDLYDGDVLHADRQLGAFLDLLRTLGLYDPSLIIVTSDHGEEFAEHQGYGHSRTLFEELLAVPLVIKLPNGTQAGTRVETRVSLVDVVPTVLAVLGADSAASLDGVSLVGVEPPAESRPLRASVRLGPGAGFASVDLTALGADMLKCIASATATDRFDQPLAPLRAFDLAQDPNEQAVASSSALTACRSLLSAAPDLVLPEGEKTNAPLSEEERARLQALGYL